MRFLNWLVDKPQWVWTLIGACIGAAIGQYVAQMTVYLIFHTLLPGTCK